MNKINLEDYGEIISTEEYLIDKEYKLISSFLYEGNVDTKYTEGKIEINSSFIREDDISKYEVCIEHKCKDSNNIAILRFNTKKLLPLYEYKNIIEDILSNKSKDIKLPAKKYTYESASEKTENDFTINVTCNNTDVSFIFEKGYELIVDGRVVFGKKDNDKTILYIIGDKSYKKIENDMSGNIDTISYVDFSCNEPYVVNLSDYKSNSSICYLISHLMTVPEKMTINNNQNIIFEYDEYGLLISSSIDSVLNEGVFFNDNDLDYKLSVHPLYYDNFNTELIHGNNIYCLDILINESDKYYKYIRQLYRIDPLKIIKLDLDLKEGENSKYPVIQF